MINHYGKKMLISGHSAYYTTPQKKGILFIYLRSTIKLGFFNNVKILQIQTKFKKKTILTSVF